MAYGSLRFVDMVGQNFLFRGSSPVMSGYGQYCFDYDGLKQAMKSAPDLPRSLPDPFYMMVISLLYEWQEIDTEVQFFGGSTETQFGSTKNTSFLGQLQLWDTYGTPVCYFQKSPAERQQLLASFDQWLGEPLVWRTATLRSWLEGAPLPVTPYNTALPIVFYVHCDGGCDRTGEMVAAYRLRYMGWSWKQVWSEQPCISPDTPVRPMGCDNYRALQWFAFWLNTTQGFSITGIGDDGGCADPPNKGGIHRACYEGMP
jgi:hypothetical protein